jgi:hypothetical protein
VICGKTVATRTGGSPARAPMSSTERTRASSLAATTMRQRPKPRVEQRVEAAAALADQVPAGDARVGGAVGDELGDVLGAHEDRLELAAERRGEGAVAARPDRQAGVGEQLARLVGEATFVGKGDAEHEGVVRGRATDARGGQTKAARREGRAAAGDRGRQAGRVSGWRPAVRIARRGRGGRGAARGARGDAGGAPGRAWRSRGAT